MRGDREDVSSNHGTSGHLLAEQIVLFENIENNCKIGMIVALIPSKEGNERSQNDPSGTLLHS